MATFLFISLSAFLQLIRRNEKDDALLAVHLTLGGILRFCNLFSSSVNFVSSICNANVVHDIYLMLKFHTDDTIVLVTFEDLREQPTQFLDFCMILP